MFGRRPPEACKSSYSRLEDRGIRYLQAEIESIDPEARQVETSAGTLTADSLVVGLGVELAPQDTPGFVESGGHTFYTFEGAFQLRHLFVEKGIRDEVQIDILIPDPKPIPVSDTVSQQIEDPPSRTLVWQAQSHLIPITQI